MAWQVPAAFEEAVQWFRSRLPVTDEQYEAMVAEERARAFRIAGAAQLSIVQDVHDEIGKALAAGEGIDSWAARTRERIKDRWAKPSSARLETIFRNATQTAYGTGRWYQQQDPEVTDVRPYMRYDAVLDERTTELCESLNGTIRLHDDPFVAEYWSPNHHRCRGQWQSISRRAAREAGGPTVDVKVPTPPEGFGKAPPLRGDGWHPDPNEHDPVAYSTYLTKQEALRNEDT